jgi:hypothetical protein
MPKVKMPKVKMPKVKMSKVKMLKIEMSKKIQGMLNSSYPRMGLVSSRRG